MEEILWCNYVIITVMWCPNLLCLWIKSYGTTIHKKPIHTIVLTLNSVDKILCGDHLNGTSSAVLSHGTIYLVCSSTFESVDEILLCYHSNEISLAVLSHGTIY